MPTETRETIGPDQARAYLASNTANRPVSRPYVRVLAADMAAGRWLDTHQGIAFDDAGALLDGQHRLLAIVEADVPVTMLVTRGLDRAAFHVIDQHRRRTAAQILTMDGLRVDAPRLAAMARAILQVVHGAHRASNTETTAFALAHADTLRRYLPVARRFSPAVGAAFAWADMLGWAGVESAASRLVESLWAAPGDPMRALARRAESFRRMGTGASDVKVKFDLALHALLADHEGRDLSVLRSSAPDYAAIVRASERPAPPPAG